MKSVGWVSAAEATVTSRELMGYAALTHPTVLVLPGTLRS